MSAPTTDPWQIFALRLLDVLGLPRVEVPGSSEEAQALAGARRMRELADHRVSELDGGRVLVRFKAIARTHEDIPGHGEVLARWPLCSPPAVGEHVILDDGIVLAVSRVTLDSPSEATAHCRVVFDPREAAF